MCFQSSFLGEAASLWLQLRKRGTQKSSSCTASPLATPTFPHPSSDWLGCQQQCVFHPVPLLLHPSLRRCSQSVNESVEKSTASLSLSLLTSFLFPSREQTVGRASRPAQEGRCCHINAVATSTLEATDRLQVSLWLQLVLSQPVCPSPGAAPAGGSTAFKL